MIAEGHHELGCACRSDVGRLQVVCCLFSNVLSQRLRDGFKVAFAVTLPDVASQRGMTLCNGCIDLPAGVFQQGLKTHRSDTSTPS